jgi:hypothetical protein
MAVLCGKCKGNFFMTAMGQCKQIGCPNSTTSRSYKACETCASEKKICQACAEPMKSEKEPPK